MFRVVTRALENVDGRERWRGGEGRVAFRGTFGCDLVGDGQLRARSGWQQRRICSGRLTLDAIMGLSESRDLRDIASVADGGNC